MDHQSGRRESRNPSDRQVGNHQPRAKINSLAQEPLALSFVGRSVTSDGREGESLRVRLVEGVEKWMDGKYLVFPLVYLVRGVEKWEGGKLFYLVGEKKRMMKNIIYIN